MTNYTEKVYLLLDVGGTQIKGAVFDEEGNRKTDISSYPSKSRESADVILDNFAFILRELMNTNPQAEIIGVGMAFPGPFDYEKGICQIQGLNKYDSIYGRALEPEMKMLNLVICTTLRHLQLEKHGSEKCRMNQKSYVFV